MEERVVIIEEILPNMMMVGRRWGRSNKTIFFMRLGRLPDSGFRERSRAYLGPPVKTRVGPSAVEEDEIEHFLHDVQRQIRHQSTKASSSIALSTVSHNVLRPVPRVIPRLSRWKQ